MPETSSTARRGGNLAIWSQDAAVDADGDGISNSLEQTLISFGRLPAGADTKKDSDLDGLSDFVELVGVPATSLAGGDSSLAMPWQGSLGGPDPAVQDLFIEVDWMEDAAPATAHSHEPYANLAADLTSIFTSDSAWTGRNIRVHLDRSQSVGHWDRISYSTCGGAGDVNFYTIKNNSSFFDPLRNLVYHYVVVAHSEKNTACVATASSGRAEIFGNDVYVTFGGTNGTNLQQRGTHVHEMGHNLYLDHNSNDDASAANRSCVHSSVMNYRYHWEAGPTPETPCVPRGTPTAPACQATPGMPVSTPAPAAAFRRDRSRRRSPVRWRPAAPTPERASAMGRAIATVPSGPRQERRLLPTGFRWRSRLRGRHLMARHCRRPNGRPPRKHLRRHA